MSATDTQVGGSHYKDFEIQPAEFLHKNKIGYLEGSAVYYIIRHREKNGAEDLQKAIHTLQLILQIEYSVTEKENSEYRDLVGNLYTWVAELPIKHPQQARWREQAKKIFDR